MTQEKILIRVPQWLGDAVVSTVFIREVKRRFPECSLSVLGSPSFQSIFSSMTEVDSYLPLPHPYTSQTWTVGSELKSKRFSRLYCLPRSARCAIEAFASRIPKRIGFGGGLRGLAFTETKSYVSESLYPDRYVRLLGDIPPNLDRKPFFPSSERSLGDLLSPPLLASGTPRAPYLGMAPFSIAPARTWASENFISVANRFYDEKKGTVILIGSRSEEKKLASLQKELKGPSALNAGQLNFSDLGALFKGLNGFIGNDSGLMHVASAFEVPSVIIFGASDSTWALPQVESMTALQDKELFCAPCLKNHCYRKGAGHLECLKNISPDNAAGQVIRSLRG